VPGGQAAAAGRDAARAAACGSRGHSGCLPAGGARGTRGHRADAAGHGRCHSCGQRRGRGRPGRAAGGDRPPEEVCCVCCASACVGWIAECSLLVLQQPARRRQSHRLQPCP
jgi:hypothetical protein